MPSTGTNAFTVTRDQLISSALRTLRVLIEGQTASAQQLADCSQELNLILKSWATNGLKLWCYQQIVVPMAGNQLSYTIGPTGADVTAARPMRVFERGNFIRFVNGGTNYDTPLRLLSRAEYMQFGAKSTPGVPNSIYYHPGIDLVSGLTSPATGYGTLYVFVAPSDATRSIYLNCDRQIYDMTSGADEFDLPQEWFMAIKYALMAAVADDYEVDEYRIMRITNRATQLLESSANWSTEEASTTFSPDFSGRN